MKVFISWSGTRSRSIAMALRDWIGQVLQQAEPWMSETDVDAGARWGSEMAKELEQTSCGIICLTKDNQSAPWILFEAGALAKSLSHTFVCPYLVDLTPTEIRKGPLTHFQAKKATEKETWELVCTLNRALKDNARPKDKLRETFERWWPDLKAAIDTLPPDVEGGSRAVRRSSDNMTEEILEIVRGLARSTSAVPDIPSLADLGGRRRTSSIGMTAWEILVEYGLKTRYPRVWPLMCSPQSSVFDVLSEVFWRLSRDDEALCKPRAYTYLWDWILVNKTNEAPLIMRGVTQRVAASEVFHAGEHWEVVPLAEPVIHKGERFGLMRGSRETW